VQRSRMPWYASSATPWGPRLTAGEPTVRDTIGYHSPVVAPWIQDLGLHREIRPGRAPTTLGPAVEPLARSRHPRKAHPPTLEMHVEGVVVDASGGASGGGSIGTSRRAAARGLCASVEQGRFMCSTDGKAMRASLLVRAEGYAQGVYNVDMALGRVDHQPLCGGLYWPASSSTRLASGSPTQTLNSRPRCSMAASIGYRQRPIARVVFRVQWPRTWRLYPVRGIGAPS
jgi:hypothetical protein